MWSRGKPPKRVKKGGDVEILDFGLGKKKGGAWRDE
jgi:hypothetical protein